MVRFLLISMIMLPFFAKAQLRVARIFDNHAVLQRQKPIPIWGWATANESINLTFAGQQKSTIADKNGYWKVNFDAMEAGGPYELQVKSKSQTKTLKDILVGEVWICSGQSNMEWTVSQCNNHASTTRSAKNPNIRQFKVQHDLALQPEQDLQEGNWLVCSPKTVGQFTGVGYFFAMELADSLNIPVGLINTTWGGSQVESWISQEAMLSNPVLRNYAQNMPLSWTEGDALQEAKIKKHTLKNTSLTTTKEQENAYTTANFDFSTWPQYGLPGSLDWQGFWAFRGKAYMGRVMEIPEDWLKETTTLSLGENDSEITIHANGNLIYKGATHGKIKIDIQPGIWQVGHNQLMVTFGTIRNPDWYGLGFMGEEKDFYLEVDGDKLLLADDQWRVMPSFSDKYQFAKLQNNIGATLYNAMIHPLHPLAFRGALWYQGETNAERAHEYRQTFPLMIQDWRKKWGEDFPFYFVQLTSYGKNKNANEGSNWAELREAQTQTLSLPNTGMAVITDLGDPNDIHPTNKKDVGHRLAMQVLNVVYKKPIFGFSPLFESAEIQADKVIIRFKNTGRGLVAKDKFGYLKGFEIAGADQKFQYAKADIIDNQVVVWAPKDMQPSAVRYGWSDAVEDINLINLDGYPASPFRTDAWKGVTENAKFDIRP
jgi:sialate O-acetylesterase